MKRVGKVVLYNHVGIRCQLAKDLGTLVILEGDVDGVFIAGHLCGLVVNRLLVKDQ